MNSEEIKNEFINCIEGTHTLNLAVSILEERDLYHSIIKELEKWLKTRNGIKYYPEAFDKLQELKHKKIYGSVDSEIIYFDEVGSDKE